MNDVLEDTSVETIELTDDIFEQPCKSTSGGATCGAKANWMGFADCCPKVLYRCDAHKLRLEVMVSSGKLRHKVCGRPTRKVFWLAI